LPESDIEGIERLLLISQTKTLTPVRGKSSRDLAPDPRRPSRDENSVFHHQLLSVRAIPAGAAWSSLVGAIMT
jgi:hypothetical protein